MGQAVLHGLIQKARLDAEALHQSIRINADGAIWRWSPNGGWKDAGDKLKNPRDREDFLLSQLTQEDR